MTIELDDMMRDCIIEADKEYPDLDYADTVIEAFRSYVIIMGSPVEFESEEEGEEYFKKAVAFLVDCVLFNMVEKGFIEIEGMEDGEFWYKATAEF